MSLLHLGKKKNTKVASNNDDNLEPLQSRTVVLNPLAVFPSKVDSITSAFFSVDVPKHTRKVDNSKKWLHLDKIDPTYGLQVKLFHILFKAS